MVTSTFSNGRTAELYIMTQMPLRQQPRGVGVFEADLMLPGSLTDTVRHDKSLEPTTCRATRASHPLARAWCSTSRTPSALVEDIDVSRCRWV